MEGLAFKEPKNRRRFLVVGASELRKLTELRFEEVCVRYLLVAQRRIFYVLHVHDSWQRITEKNG